MTAEAAAPAMGQTVAELRERLDRLRAVIAADDAHWRQRELLDTTEENPWRRFAATHTTTEEKRRWDNSE